MDKKVKDYFPKSEKWLPVTVVIWGMFLVSIAIYGAWEDSERYAAAVDALGRSIEVLVSSLIAAATVYTVFRHKHKETVIKLNGVKPPELSDSGKDGEES